MENVLSANAPRESVARTMDENVPRVVGVPVVRRAGRTKQTAKYSWATS